MDYAKAILVQYLVTAGWAITGALSMGLGLAVALKIFNVMTPQIDELDELKKGNIAVAIVLAAVVLGTAAVVAVAILPETAH